MVYFRFQAPFLLLLPICPLLAGHRVPVPGRSMHAYMLSRLSCIQLFVIPWTIACQAPLSMGFSRQEYWSGLPFLSPGDLPDPGIEPASPTLQADSLPSEPLGFPVKHKKDLK